MKKIQETIENPPAEVTEERERKRSVTPQRKSKSPEPQIIQTIPQQSSAPAEVQAAEVSVEIKSSEPTPPETTQKEKKKEGK